MNNIGRVLKETGTA